MPTVRKRVDIAGALEAVVALAVTRVEQLTRGERALDRARDAGPGRDERHLAAEHPLEHRRAQRVVGGAEDHGVDVGGTQRRAVGADGLDHLLVEREAGLDDPRQVRAGHALEVDVGIGGR